MFMSKDEHRNYMILLVNEDVWDGNGLRRKIKFVIMVDLMVSLIVELPQHFDFIIILKLMNIS